MFPVAAPDGHITLESSNSGEFWIPDIPILHEYFQGLAPLLDLTESPEGVKIGNIVAALGLEDMLLTAAVRTEHDACNETGWEDKELTQRLRIKADSIKGQVCD